jgi:hypothetical protein
MASMRVSDALSSGKWPQIIINIPNVAFLPTFFNQILFLSAPSALYRHLKKQCPTPKTCIPHRKMRILNKSHTFVGPLSDRVSLTVPVPTLVDSGVLRKVTAPKLPE